MFIEARGSRLHALEFGSGARTLVLVGGWVAPWDLWAELVAPASRDFRVIAYDHRGAGESPLGDEPVTVDLLAEDLTRVLDHFAVDTCLLAAESQGSAVALCTAATWPERVEGVLAVGASASFPTLPAAVLEATAAGLLGDPDTTLRAVCELGMPEDPDGVLRRSAFHMLRRAEVDATVRLLRFAADVTSLLPQVTVPVELVHGGVDRIVSPTFAEALAEALPSATLTTLDGVGHVPVMTRPQAVLDALHRLAARTATDTR